MALLTGAIEPILIVFKVDVARPLDAVQYLPLTFTTLSRSLTAAEMTQAIF